MKEKKAGLFTSNRDRAIDLSTSKRGKIDLSTFKRVQQDMVAKNDRALDEFYSYRYVHRLKDYTNEEIEQIINSSSLASQQELSRNYYDKNGFYNEVNIVFRQLYKYKDFSSIKSFRLY